MTVSPQGNIYLCKTHLENDYKNQLTFSSSANQLAYFNSTIQKTYSNYTYIKKDNSVKVGENIDALIGCNYLFYVNTGFTSKHYFCFITNMEYVNENCTLITFETDCFQTWMFQINYHPCFVEREHVNNDTVGIHTVPENIETGEFVCNQMDYFSGLDDVYYVILSTEYLPSDYPDPGDPDPEHNKPLATNFGGIYMAGCAYVCIDMREVVNILKLYSDIGKSEAVYSLYMIPRAIMEKTPHVALFPGQNTPVFLNETISKPSTINGYSPKNNKLFCYPYNYLLVSNNNGSSNILHYERFSTSTCNFNIKGVPVVGGSIKLTPANYDSVSDNEEQGIIAGKFPTLNWSKDEYTNWLTQNSVNIGLGIASDVLPLASSAYNAYTTIDNASKHYTATSLLPNLASGAASGAGVGAAGGPGGAAIGAAIGGVVSGLIAVGKDIASVYQHSFQPNSAKGSVNGGDINVCSGKNGFCFYKMSIKQEYARIIDDYFSMFGYKVNSVKTPNITGRSNWNYVKTVDCNFDGDIPQEHMNIIKNMFNNGVTLWHNPSTIYNYSNSNSIV